MWYCYIKLEMVKWWNDDDVNEQVIISIIYISENVELFSTDFFWIMNFNPK